MAQSVPLRKDKQTHQSAKASKGCNCQTGRGCRQDHRSEDQTPDGRASPDCCRGLALPFHCGYPPTVYQIRSKTSTTSVRGFRGLGRCGSPARPLGISAREGRKGGWTAGRQQQAASIR